MQYALVEGRVRIERTAEEQEPLLQRLRRIEGQARGLQQMIVENRYCLDDVQQLNACAGHLVHPSVSLQGLRRALIVVM